MWAMIVFLLATASDTTVFEVILHGVRLAQGPGLALCLVSRRDRKLRRDTNHVPCKFEKEVGTVLWAILSQSR